MTWPRWGGLAAWLPALLLCACASAPKPAPQTQPPEARTDAALSSPAQAASSSSASTGEDDTAAARIGSFEVDIAAPDDVRPLLERHLELMRYRALPDLDRYELDRLLLAAEQNARELVGTLGYFSPTINVRLRDAGAAGAKPRVAVTVEPGPPTRVQEVLITFGGDITSEGADLAGRRAELRAAWPLNAGQRFTQQAWDSAKDHVLRQLGAQRYPMGQIAASRAEIDPATHSARLTVTYDSGASYRFGGLQVKGLERYDATLVQRLARIPAGTYFDRDALQEAQQRLQDSGYFNSVFLSLDTTGDPAFAPVLAQISEVPNHRLVLGVGVSSDTGPRASIEHTMQQLPGIGWRAVSKLQASRQTPLASVELTSPPDEDAWRWSTLAELKREESADVDIRSQKLRAGRFKTGETIDRNYYLQYDRAITTTLGVPETAQAISANYAWTQRNFNSLPFPSSGYGLAAELGGGFTLGAQKAPFARVLLRTLTVWSLGAGAADAETAARAGRIELRTQTGAVFARPSAVIPGSQLFLTGGDSSVRGYDYHAIGVEQAAGNVTPGRYLLVGSVEYQRPIVLDGQISDWEAVTFIDVGAVADKPRQFKAKVGIGAGARWRSPLGPLQLDLAYGIQPRRLRLHVSVGFSF